MIRSVDITEDEDKFIREFYNNKFSHAIHKLIQEKMKKVLYCETCKRRRVLIKNMPLDGEPFYCDFYVCEYCGMGIPIKSTKKPIPTGKEKEEIKVEYPKSIGFFAYTDDEDDDYE